MVVSPQPPEAGLYGHLPTDPRGRRPWPSPHSLPRLASTAVSPRAGVHSRLPTDAPPSLQPLAGRGSHETTPVRRAKAAASRPAAERDLAPGARSGLTFRHVLVDSALHLREAPLEVVAARRAAAASGSCNRARRQAGPAPPHHRPSARPLAHGPHLPWRGRDAPS